MVFRRAAPHASVIAVRSSGAAPKRASAHPSASGGGFFLCAEAEGLAQSKVQGEARRPGLPVDWDADLSGLCDFIEASKRCGFHARIAAGTYGRAGVERIDPVQILTRSDVKRRAGLRDQEWTQAETPAKACGATNKRSMSYIERSAAIIFVDAARCSQGEVRRSAGYRGDITGTGCVAVRIAQRVIAPQGQIGSHLCPGVHDELILLEDSARRILICDLRRGGRRGARNQRNIVCIELMHAARIEIGNGKIRILAKLPLDA